MELQKSDDESKKVKVESGNKSKSSRVKTANQWHFELHVLSQGHTYGPFWNCNEGHNWTSTFCTFQTPRWHLNPLTLCTDGLIPRGSLTNVQSMIFIPPQVLKYWFCWAHLASSSSFASSLPYATSGHPLLHFPMILWQCGMLHFHSTTSVHSPCFKGKAEEDTPRNAPAETHEKEKLSPSSCVSEKHFSERAEVECVGSTPALRWNTSFAKSCCHF